MAPPHHLLPLLALLLPTLALGQGLDQLSTAELESRVADLFEQSCALSGCHTGPTPQMEMDLSPEQFFQSTVGQASQERPDLLRVHPGRPDSSYLVMKVEGAEGIVGTPMPFTGDKLTPQEIATIRAWIGRLSEEELSGRSEAPPADPYPFVGWKVVNLPTNRTVPRGTLLFLIGHRFNPRLGSGYETFYGLDGSGIIFLNLGYAVTDYLFVNVGRSNADDDVELNLKGLLARQGPWPLSVGGQATVNWFSEEPPGVASRFRREALKLTAQVILTRAFGDRVGTAVVPGILFNPSVAEEDEPPLLTLGLGGRWRFHGDLSLVAEWVPIVGGYTRTSTFGNDNRFDSWAGGVEIATAGHVFQVVVSNSVGLATDQYLRGGDLDLFEADLRLGFNIFRVLNL